MKSTIFFKNTIPELILSLINRFFFPLVYFNMKKTRSVGQQFARNKRVSLAIQHIIQVQ